MIILSLINSWQRRDRQLPRGGKVGRIKGLPVVNFGWFRKKSKAGVAERRHTSADTPAEDPTIYQWTPPVEPDKSA